MEYTQLGRTGLTVSRLVLGTMNFGPATTEPDSFRIMDEAHELGLNVFDTANVYGGELGRGATETIVGNWLAQGNGRRERTVLATKVFNKMGDWPNESRLSATHIRRACDESLRRLQTDHIDLYQMHHVDRQTPWEEIWTAMDILRTQGKVTYVGTSNFAGWHIAQGQETATRLDTLGLSSEQCIYNLINRSAEREVLPACEAYGIGVIPWSPLDSGLLGGILRKQAEGRRRYEGRAERDLEPHRAQLVQWEALCDELGHEPSHVAIAWLLTRPAVTAPIVGPRTSEQLAGMAAALDVTLDAATLQRIDEIFPGPGPSPEDFAW
ncbi:MAG: aldo/keto reductase [Actinomycetota bacterium]|nr:MAG: aldo/keto reductase [Actinomycetota bacterium]